MSDFTIDWLDTGLKYAVLLFCAFYLFMRCVNEMHARSAAPTPDGGTAAASGREPYETDTIRKIQKRNWYSTALFSSLSMGFSFIWIRAVVFPMNLLLMVVFVILINCLLYRNRQHKLSLNGIVTLSVICFAFCDAVFMIVGIIGSVPLMLYYERHYPLEKHNIELFLNDTPVHIAVYLFMIFMVWLLTYFAANVNRLRGGLIRIVSHSKGGVGIILSITLLTVVTAFAASDSEDYTPVKAILFIFVIAFCVLMIIWIHREISAEYLRQCRKRNIEITVKSLAQKEEEIASLMEDNAHLAGTVRQDRELIAELICAMKRSSDLPKLAAIVEDLEGIYRNRSAALSLYEAQGAALLETGVRSIDAILAYMQSKAEAAGVAFDLSVQADLPQALTASADRREFDIILADLSENAIISAKNAEGGAVRVNLLGGGDKSLFLEILDSGEPFAAEVLREFGKKRFTTHADEGGSGIGMMSLSKILRHNGASFEIEDFSQDNGTGFTKAVRVIFDGQSRIRLLTFRAEEWRKILTGSQFEIIQCK